MAIKKFQNKSLKSQIEDKEVFARKDKEKYFFPDIDGHAITVEADSREEAEKKARELINKSK